MKALIAVLLLMDVYMLVYYRLLVRFYYEKVADKKESAFGAIFSIPPYKILPERGRKYARRYWGAVSVMFLCVGALYALSDFQYPQ